VSEVQAPRELLTFGCGIGTQSTAITLLVKEGRLPKPDAVLFSDTGWEPREVYENLAVIKQLWEEMGVPFYVVGRGSSIRDDVLNRRVYATIPAFTIVEKTERAPLAWERCDCAWAKVFGIGGEGGVGALREFNAKIPADLIRRHLDIEADDGCLLCQLDSDGSLRGNGATALLMLEEAGLDEVPPSHDRCRSEGRIPTKFHTYTVKEKGRIKRECTGKYKIEPIERKIRELLGAKVRDVTCKYCTGSGRRVAPWDAAAGEGPCSVCRGTGTRRLVGPAPRGSKVTHWIGFSTDEIDRATTVGFRSHTTPAYPLMDLGMTRADCEDLIRAHGLIPVKSACVGCPFHGNAYWRHLRDNSPADWADAVEFDRQLRQVEGANLRGQRYLHISCVPLDQASLGKPSRAELASAQGDLLKLMEEGSPLGCSPYGCRSSEDEPITQVDLPMPVIRVGAA
jgi:hypothetical protein